MKILFAGYTLDLQLHLLSTLKVFTIDQELFALFLLQLGLFSIGEYKFYPVKGNQWKFREKLKKEFPQIDKKMYALHILKNKFLPQTDYSVLCGGPDRASSVLSHPQYPNPVAFLTFFCYKHVDHSSFPLSVQSKIFFIQVRVKVHKSHHQYNCQQQNQN